MLNYYVIFLFRQFMETLNQFLHLSRTNCNFEASMTVWFEQLKELKQFWGNFTRQYFNKLTLSQKCKRSCSVETTTCSHIIFTWLSSVNSYSKCFTLNSCTFSIFHALEIKKLVLVGKILWRFDIILHIWLIHFLFD